jgi:acetylornithine aminotransferase
LYETRPQKELAARLAGLTGGMRSFFCNSGAEAIECAIKLARKAAGPHRSRIIAATGGFHGRTMGALAATGQPAKWVGFEPLLPGFTHVPFGNVAAIEAELAADVAAVLLEPIQGEAGVIVPSPDYLQDVRALCDRAGALLILDEVQTGLARTGAWFAYEHSGIVPDILCLAKALAGGLPIGVCLARPEVAAAFVPGDHGSTFGGGPVQCAAANVVLDVIETEGLIERAASSGGLLSEGLRRISSGQEVRGVGLLIAVQLDGPVARDVASAAFDRGLLVNDAAPNVVRFCPPLVITEQEINRALTILEEVWHEVTAA